MLLLSKSGVSWLPYSRLTDLIKEYEHGTKTLKLSQNAGLLTHENIYEVLLFTIHDKKVYATYGNFWKVCNAPAITFFDNFVRFSAVFYLDR